jgi:dTDP-4-dehydrorhamnose 3,5-epimerase
MGTMTETIDTPLLIEGVTLTKLGQFPDERGAVLHMLRSDSPEFTRFGECYFSEVFPGVVKAWKRHSRQTQNLAVPIGRARIVIYDDRDNSPSYGQLQVIDLGRPDAYLRLKIPPSLWYGFAGTSPVPALLVNCTDRPHEPHESDVRPLNHPDIPYQWDVLTTGFN